MRVNIIGTQAKTTGLTQDTEILHGMLVLILGKTTEIRHIPHYYPQCPEAEINFFVESMNPALFAYARRNIWIPNPEWTYQTWKPYGAMVDEIWVKTHEAEKLFENWSNVKYIGWTSIDKIPDTVKDWNKAVFPTGNNMWRNPKPIVQAYMRIQEQKPDLYHRLPVMHIVSRVQIPPIPESVSGKIVLYKDVLPKEEYDSLVKTSGLCCCLSAAEGFGHAVNEAMSTGSICLLSPIEPFHELTENAIWVSMKKATPHPQCLGSLVDIEIESLVEALAQYVNMNDRLTMSTAVRTEYQDRHEQFMMTMEKELERFVKDEPFSMQDHLPKEVDLPMVSVVTITRDRRQFIPLAKYLFLAQSYPQEKMEWIIVDDGKDQIKDLVSDLPNVKYVLVDEPMTIGEKRNLAVELAEHSILVMMDDDDIYPKNSVLSRVAHMLAEPKHECLFSTTIPCYQIHEKKSFMNVPPMTLSMSERVSEATLCFTRAFWNERKFPDKQIAEGDAFIRGREQMCRELSPHDVIVSLVHKKNSSSRKPPQMESNGCHYGFSDELFTLVSEIAESI